MTYINIMYIDYKMDNLLTNQQYGQYYETAKCLSIEEKCQLGIKLLLKSYRYYILEGENQLKLNDI